MKKEELFDEIVGHRCLIHFVVEGISEEFREMTIDEIDNHGQLLGAENEGMFSFNWNGAQIEKNDEDIYEINKEGCFIEISFAKG